MWSTNHAHTGTAFAHRPVERAPIAIGAGRTRVIFFGPDGSLLMIKIEDGTSRDGASDALTQVVLVLNWFEELTELVPAP